MRGKLALACVVIATGACRKNDGARVLDGAGATLPLPLYTKWSTEFAKADPSVRVNYQPLGSGAGIRQMSDGVADFGATDEPMTDDQIAHLKGEVVHIPMTVGGVVIAFNLPGVPELRLTADTIADVFRGVITRWDDPRLVEVNPGAALPSQPITIVHRADGSGTSAAFATYLAKNSAAWKAEVGAGVAPRFPTGAGARGNDGVVAFVRSTPLAIGYAELAYAKSAGLATALVKNRAGNFIRPEIASLERAASAVGDVPEDLRVSVVDAADPGAYPITALSYLIVPRDAKDRAKGEALARFVWWGLHDGQSYAAALDYAPLPAPIVERAERAVRSLRVGGQLVAIDKGGG